MSKALKPYEAAVGKVARFYSARLPAYAKGSLKWAAEKEHILNLLRGSKTLKEATDWSIEQAILHGAAMGLSFNPNRPGVYMIPRRMWKADPNAKKAERRTDGPVVAGASPSYMGLTHVAVRSGFAKIIRAQVVFSTDRFEYLGPLEKPVYKMDHKKPMKWDRADGVFAIALLDDGNYACEWMDRETVERIRALSDNPNGLMWNPQKLWTEGWRKTAIRRLFKTIPVDMGPPLELATQLMNTNEGITIEGTAVQVDESPSDDPVIQPEQVTEIEKKAEEAGLPLKTLLGAYHLETLDELPSSMYTPVLDRIASYAERKTQEG